MADKSELDAHFEKLLAALAQLSAPEVHVHVHVDGQQSDPEKSAAVEALRRLRKRAAPEPSRAPIPYVS